MNILHYKQTPLAYAPDELSKCINKYSNIHSQVAGWGHTKPSLSHYDVLHFHNKFDKTLGVKYKRSVIQYHSEPFMVHLGAPVNKKLVISQYHCTLKEFKPFRVVRNVIDFVDSPIFKYNEVSDRIIVGFSPSRTNSFGRWHNKGYSETINVLKKLKRKYPKKIDFDVITGVPLDQCMKRKAKCNVIIDEVVTDSFHRSGLEGLALGKLTICSLSKSVENVLIKHSGADMNPFNNVYIHKLESELEKLIEMGPALVNEIGVNNREWMEKYWHPKTIVNDFIKIYKGL